MKKSIVIFILLFILFSFLFAECAKEEVKIEPWKIVGIIFTMFVILIVCFFISVRLSQNSSDSSNIPIRIGEGTDLKLNLFLSEKEDEITLKFLIKKIAGNRITLQCKVCKKGEILLTKLIGVEKGKRVNTRIKKVLNHPIKISVCCSNSNDNNQIKIDVERIPSAENISLDSYPYIFGIRD